MSPSKGGRERNIEVAHPFQVLLPDLLQTVEASEVVAEFEAVQPDPAKHVVNVTCLSGLPQPVGQHF